MGSRRMWRVAGVTFVAGLAVVAITGSAIANGAVVTRGSFATLPAAVGQPEQGLVGRAQTVRSSDGSTHIEVSVRGLRPGDDGMLGDAVVAVVDQHLVPGN